MLFNAYKNIPIENGYGEEDDWFWIKTGSSGENIDDIMNRIFADIYLIDSFVHNSSDEYEMVGFDFSAGQNMIHIEYHGIQINTQFDVRIYQDNGKWYCMGIGIMHYAKPVCMNDFPTGYSREGFKTENFWENRRRYFIVYN